MYPSRPASCRGLYGTTPGAGSTAGAEVISGTISARPPTLTVSTMRTPSSPLAFSMTSCFTTRSSRGLEDGGHDDAAPELGCLPDVVGHEQHAAEHEQAAE